MAVSGENMQMVSNAQDKPHGPSLSAAFHDHCKMDQKECFGIVSRSLTVLPQITLTGSSSYEKPNTRDF